MKFLGVLKSIGSVLGTGTGGKESGLVSIFKANAKGLSSKRLVKVLGGGGLIAGGLALTATIDFDGLAVAIKWKAIIGLSQCALGVLLAWLMKSHDNAGS